MLARLGQQSALGTYWKDRVKRYKIDVVKQFFLKMISFEISANRLKRSSALKHTSFWTHRITCQVFSLVKSAHETSYKFLQRMPFTLPCIRCVFYTVASIR